jgi:hypothetical protein
VETVSGLRRTGLAPFRMLGATWPGAEGAALARVHGLLGWGPWFPLPALGGHGPDPGSAEAARARAVTQPAWVGSADGYELRLAGAAPPAGVHLVRPGEGPGVAGRANGGGGGLRVASVSPAVLPRSAWQAAPPAEPIDMAPSLVMAFAHHTATPNGYAGDDVPAILRGMQAYHMHTNGWNDIGYNFVVDRFGRVWEARAGSLDGPAVGAHTGGYNTGSLGVALLGNHEGSGPAAGAVDSLAWLVGTRLWSAGVDPRGAATLNGRTFAAVSGHGDAVATACPGRHVVPLLPAIRELAARYRPDAPPPPPPDLLTSVLQLLDSLLRPLSGR